MNNDRFERRMERRYRRHHDRKSNVWTGLFLLAIGALLLARNAGILFPVWFFTWPVFLIALGFFIGVRHSFRGGAWLVMMLVGGIFLAEQMDNSLHLRPYLWPIILIAVGLLIILRPKCRRRMEWNNGDDLRSDASSQTETASKPSGSDGYSSKAGDFSEVLDVTAVFAGIKKKILSKQFKGGDVVSVMGGTELDLTQADFTGKIVIDNFTMFGGTKLIVPADWEVQSQVVAILGGVDDKRPPSMNHDPSKVLYLEGTCILGGIEIRSY